MRANTDERTRDDAEREHPEPRESPRDAEAAREERRDRVGAVRAALPDQASAGATPCPPPRPLPPRRERQRRAAPATLQTRFSRGRVRRCPLSRCPLSAKQLFLFRADAKTPPAAGSRARGGGAWPLTRARAAQALAHGVPVVTTWRGAAGSARPPAARPPPARRGLDGSGGAWGLSGRRGRYRLATVPFPVLTGQVSPLSSY